MPTIAQLKDGRWIMTYEFVNAPIGGVPVYYRLSDDPLSRDDKKSIIIKPEGDVLPGGTPYVVVADNGKIIVSSNTQSAVFVNGGDASVDGWRIVSLEQRKSYSRCLTLITEAGEGKQYLFLTSGGSFQADSSVNTVAVGVQDFVTW